MCLERFEDYEDSENCLNFQKLCQGNLNLWHIPIDDKCQFSWDHEINSNEPLASKAPVSSKG